MTVDLIYETHSTTTDNENGLATGWLPGQLSETGREQARALGERRRADGLAVVFSSDLARAVETAQLAFAGSGIPIRQDPRLRECDYGTLNGMLIAHSANRWALANLLDGVPLEDQVDAPFAWQKGWHYTVPAGWR